MQRDSAVSYTHLLTAAFLLSGFTVHFARNMQNKIWEKYIDYADYTDVFQQYGKKYEIEISRPNQSQMNRLDYHLSEMCDFMETYSAVSDTHLDVYKRQNLHTGSRRNLLSESCQYR